MGRLSGSNSKGRVSSSSGRLENTDDLVRLAQRKGLSAEAEQIVNPVKKLSALERLGTGLGALNPAEAILTGMEKKSVGAGVSTYLKGGINDIAEAVTGRDFDTTERRTFKDVAEEAGIENKILKGGLGFAGDILLDPSTYFGGAIAKGIGKGASALGSGALKGIGKVAPDTEKGLRLAGKGVKDALGKAFKFGYGTSKGLAEKGLEVQSKLDKAKEGIVMSNISRLGTQTLSRSQQEELVQKLLEGKRAEFAVGRSTEAGKKAAREASRSSDPLVQKAIDEQALRSQKFGKQAGIEDPFEIYYPGLNKDKVRTFIEGTSNLRVGSEGYMKEFKNLLTDEQLIRNPAEAFAKREFEMVKDNIVRGQMKQVIDQFGRPVGTFKNADEALAAGYKEIREEGAFGKPVGYLLDVDKKFLDNLITPEFTSIDMIAKATGFDALTSLFKRSVTGLFPSFHIRNFVSGHIQNFEVIGADALNPKTIYAAQKMALRLAKDDKTLFRGKFGKEMKAFADRFGTSSQYIADIADATRTTMPGIAKGVYGKTLGQDAFLFKKARAVGNFIETQQKATVYLAAIGQGKTIKEALDLATRAGFDYRALTGFESKVLRRLIPFYSFTRKNIELQLRTLGENPQRINQILALFDNIAGEISEEERAAFPDYMREGITSKLGLSESGMPEFIANFGTPVEAFTALFGFGEKNFIEKQLSTLNNIIKYPLEKAVGRDFFRDREIKDSFDAKEYQDAPQFVKDFLQFQEVQTTDFKTKQKKIKYVADPERLHLLRQLPTSRGVSYLYNIYNPDLTNDAKALYGFTGVKPTQLDIDTLQYFKEADKKEELEELLIRSGVIKRFENVYVPKK